MSNSDWPLPIRTRDDLPEGWAFIDHGDTVEPFMPLGFRRWLVMGEEGSVQRERYVRAVAAWNSGATEDEVARIMGLPPRDRRTL